MLCVFSISISAVGAQCGAGWADSGFNILPAQNAVAGCNRPHQAAGKPGQHRELPIQQVRARFADHFLAVIGVHLDRDGVAHGAGGHKQAGFFAHDFRGALFQPIDGGVFAINVVADFGFGHGAPHRGRGARDCVASQVDHVMNSANTSFENSTPRSVSRSREPSRASRPSVMKRSNGFLKLEPLFGPAAGCLA